MSAAAQLQAQGATVEEAAAIVAAIERYRRDTAAPPPLAGARAAERWLRTGRLEDVGEGTPAPGEWGDPHPWGAAPTK